MKSPFPGMDPFIEGCGLFEEFHGHLIDDMYRALADVLPERYIVRSGERSYLVLGNDESFKEHTFRPDVSIDTDKPEPASHLEETVAVASPAANADALTMEALVEEEFRETFVEIYDTDPEMRLVTCIEVLSPSNKRQNTPGWNQYLRKRQGLLRTRSANLIEIDLLRGGQRMPMRESWPNSPYTFLIARASRMPSCTVHGVHYRKRVPTLSVPLLPFDADVTLDLQPMIEAIYARSRYHRSIDYTRLLAPPLNDEDVTWLQEHLHEGARNA